MVIGNILSTWLEEIIIYTLNNGKLQSHKINISSFKSLEESLEEKAIEFINNYYYNNK